MGDDDKLTELVESMTKCQHDPAYRSRLLAQCAIPFGALASCLRHYAELRKQGRWIPWKPGDELPAEGLYWTATHPHPMLSVHGPAYVERRTDNWNGVCAYWSIPLPAPYSEDQWSKT